MATNGADFQIMISWTRCTNMENRIVVGERHVIQNTEYGVAANCADLKIMVMKTSKHPR